MAVPSQPSQSLLRSRKNPVFSPKSYPSNQPYPCHPCSIPNCQAQFCINNPTVVCPFLHHPPSSIPAAHTQQATTPKTQINPSCKKRELPTFKKVSNPHNVYFTQYNYSDSKNFTSASRSDLLMAFTLAWAEAASPPCHITASKKLRARPSCR